MQTSGGNGRGGGGVGAGVVEKRGVEWEQKVSLPTSTLFITLSKCDQSLWK